MTALSCYEARLDLQALQASEPGWEAVESHIQTCAECRQLAERKDMLDASIVDALDASIVGRSVRGEVRAHLAHRRRRTVETSASRRALKLLTVPLVLAAVVLAIALPRYATRVSENESSAQVFTPIQSGIAYPLTVDPHRSSHLLAGALGRVYESWNGGGSWKPLAPFSGSFAIRDLLIDRSEPRRYVVATNRSIIVSDDAGRHWSVAASSLPGVFNMFLLQDKRDPATYYVGPSVLWKSTDHGGTWFQAGPGRIFAPNGIQALAMARQGTLFTAIWNGGVAVSHDGGRSWQRRALGLSPKVFDVAVDGKTLWAATPGGVYSSRNDGLRWRLTTPHDHFMVTNVLASGGIVVAGGNGAVYRSVDGGRHWVLGMDGLPPAPYVYSLTADPRNPEQLYASLNTDGIFRSDDGGQSWSAMNTGLPIGDIQGSAREILFLRGGVVWRTSTTGADPGNLTVDKNVRMAVLSPDVNSVAYLAGTPERWAVRMVAAGGSGARTLETGTADMPRRLLWSPDTTRLAVVGEHTVYVSKLSGSARMWTLRTGDTVVGWTTDGHSLLVWDGSTHRLVPRRWDTGVQNGVASRAYVALPQPSPDGHHLAALHNGTLLVGEAGGPLHEVRHLPATCRLGPWSDDSAALLVHCGNLSELVPLTGDIRTVTVHGLSNWLPGSHSQLLVFQKGDMWVWGGGSLKMLVRNARPAFRE